MNTKRRRRFEDDDDTRDWRAAAVAAEEEQDDQPERAPKPEVTPAAPKEAVPKFSYEANPDVQRWLQEQSLADGRVRPKFDPTFLAGRRDALWIMSSLEHFYDQELIDDVVREVKSGKEATVYCCLANPATGKPFAAAKIYRPRMFRALRNDAVYRNTREAHDEHGNVLRDRRRQRTSGTKGRALQVSSWIQYEFATQQALYAAGAPVPVPLAQIGNAVLMEFIGDAAAPAPLLREVRLERHEARPLFDKLIAAIEIFLQCHRIHGDLSAYNILYWQGDVVIIDFAQALDPRHGEAAYEMLARDVERVCRYFAPYGVRADAETIAGEMWARYLMEGM